MTETQYVTAYVKFLSDKKELRENLREDICKLEVEFLEIQSEAIADGVEVRHVQAAINELKKQQVLNRKLDMKDNKKMKELLEDFTGYSEDA